MLCEYRLRGFRKPRLSRLYYIYGELFVWYKQQCISCGIHTIYTYNCGLNVKVGRNHVVYCILCVGWKLGWLVKLVNTAFDIVISVTNSIFVLLNANCKPHV
jgi:hypothetical protein